MQTRRPTEPWKFADVQNYQQQQQLCPAPAQQSSLGFLREEHMREDARIREFKQRKIRNQLRLLWLSSSHPRSDRRQTDSDSVRATKRKRPFRGSSTLKGDDDDDDGWEPKVVRDFFSRDIVSFFLLVQERQPKKSPKIIITNVLGSTELLVPSFAWKWPRRDSRFQWRKWV